MSQDEHFERYFEIEDELLQELDIYKVHKEKVLLLAKKISEKIESSDEDLLDFVIAYARYFVVNENYVSKMAECSGYAIDHGLKRSDISQKRKEKKAWHN